MVAVIGQNYHIPIVFVIIDFTKLGSECYFVEMPELIPISYKNNCIVIMS